VAFFIWIFFLFEKKEYFWQVIIYIIANKFKNTNLFPKINFSKNSNFLFFKKSKSNNKTDNNWWTVRDSNPSGHLSKVASSQEDRPHFCCR